jgi:hypothetical protein
MCNMHDANSTAEVLLTQKRDHCMNGPKLLSRPRSSNVRTVAMACCVAALFSWVRVAMFDGSFAIAIDNGGDDG